MVIIHWSLLDFLKGVVFGGQASFEVATMK